MAFTGPDTSPAASSSAPAPGITATTAMASTAAATTAVVTTVTAATATAAVTQVAASTATPLAITAVTVIALPEATTAAEAPTAATANPNESPNLPRAANHGRPLHLLRPPSVVTLWSAGRPGRPAFTHQPKLPNSPSSSPFPIPLLLGAAPLGLSEAE